MLAENNIYNLKDSYGAIESIKDFNGFQLVHNSFHNIKATHEHFHQNHYLSFIVNGGLEVTLENKSKYFSEGDFFIQPAGMKHKNNFMSPNTSCVKISFENEFNILNNESFFDSFRKIRNVKMTEIMNKIIKIIFAIAFISTNLYPLFAQEKGEPLNFGEFKNIYSGILNEERTIFINLPESYAESNKHYPVFYELDGYKSNILRGIAYTTRLFTEELVPEAIYVSIVNTDRNRDMYPFKTKYHPTSGGADNFLKFISQELIPFIDKNYRTTSYRTITGFSASAIFVFHTLITQPNLFEGYIACSPSLSFDTEYFIEKLYNLFDKKDTLNKTLAIVYGSAEGKAYYGEQHYFDMMNCINELTNTLITKSPKGFNWSITPVSGGKHVPYDAPYIGLKMLFQGYEPAPQPKISPSGGYIYDGEEIKINITSRIGAIHYTLDGSEPTLKSPIFEKDIIINEPLTIKAKIYNKNLDEGATITSVFKEPVSTKSIKIKNNLSQGLNYKYYEHYRWFSLPDFKEINPIATGIALKINTSHKERYEGFAISFEGLIKIDKDGQYIFSILSNDESKIILDGYDLISKEMDYSYDEKSGVVTLAKGFHSIEILYVGPAFKKKLDLAVYYEGPGIEKQEIPAEVLFHKIGN